jgi:hypothetical protein
MKRQLLAFGIAVSLGMNVNAATLELKNKATWDTIITGATDYARFGNAMVVGDFNADGKPDLAVASREEDSPRGILNVGAVSLFFGGTTFQTLKSLSTDSAGHALNNANATIFGTTENEYVGDVLAVGDFDGDKKDDLIIAAQKNGNYATNKIYIFYGGSDFKTNMTTNNAQAILKPSSMHISGIATGDLNGDGVDDIAIADDYNNKVYVVYGSTTRKTSTIDLNTASDSIISRKSIDAATIASVAIGDLNGDGKKDLAIGVPKENFSSSLTETGKIFLRKGTGNALPKTIDLDSEMGITISGGYKREHLGNSLYDGKYLNSMIFSDVNGDGIADLITGSSIADQENMTSSSGTGKVQVYFGRTNLPATIDLFDQFSLKMTVYDIDKTYLGASVKAADLNGDGINDIIMSAPNAGISAHTSGWVYVVYGKKNVSQTTIELNKSADLIIKAPDPVNALAGASWGQTLAIGDFDGDGKPDLVGGAPAGSYAGGVAKGYVLMISNPIGKTTSSTAPVYSGTLEQINGRLVVTIPSAKVVNYIAPLVVSFKLFVDLPNVTLDPSSLVMTGVAESSNPAIVDLGTSPYELRIPLLKFGDASYLVNLTSSDLSNFSVTTADPR